MKRDQMTVLRLYGDLSRTMAGPFLSRYTYPWEMLPHIGEMILELGPELPKDEYEYAADSHIWIHRSVHRAATAVITGPAIIGKGTEIRPGAFLRGNVLAGEGVVIGNSTELKNVILFDGVQVPHYNYVGDSILGYKSHMGAASLTSNVKSDKKPVKIHGEDGDIETGLKKCGAMLGDFVEVGCGSVLNPGTVIGSRSNIYPLSAVRGGVDPDSIYKREGVIVKKEERM